MCACTYTPTHTHNSVCSDSRITTFVVYRKQKKDPDSLAERANAVREGRAEPLKLDKEVRERERERERENAREYVCVCLGTREREREHCV